MVRWTARQETWRCRYTRRYVVFLSIGCILDVLFLLTNIFNCTGEEDVKADEEEADDLDGDDDIAEGKQIWFSMILNDNTIKRIHISISLAWVNILAKIRLN